MHIKLYLIAILISLLANIIYSSFINDYVHHTKHQHNSSHKVSQKFTIEDLLTKTFPYTDPRYDAQYDMDPCKAGEFFFIRIVFNALRYEIINYQMILRIINSCHWTVNFHLFALIIICISNKR